MAKRPYVAVNDSPLLITPRSKAQGAFLNCPARFILFGGAAGSLKTYSAIAAAAQFREYPSMHSIIFRRTAPELQDIMTQAHMMYREAGGDMNYSEKLYTFPSGARVRFGHAQRDKEIFKYMGPSYSGIYFDESTFFNEQPIRFMFSRLRSIDSRIPLRMALLTNPGGVSHAMHMDIFMGKTCLHCARTNESRVAMKIYDDGVWPSDKKPIWDRSVSPNDAITTCFIPGRIHDHDIYGKDGERYVGNLGALTDALRMAMMEGCWAQFEGQYYDVWNPNIHIIKYGDIKKLEGINGQLPQSWWHYWIGGDYGFKKSWATAHLFTRGPSGNIYTIGEIAENHLKARDWGAKVKEEFAPEGRNIVGAYLSPDVWAQRGDDRTIADQIMDCGMGWSTASNDRAGGAQLLYHLLADQTWYVTDTCPLLIKTIPSRVHDEKEPTKVQKVTGQPEDDAFDDARYGLYSHIETPDKPRELRVAERVTSDDPTVRALQALKAEHDIAQEMGDQDVDYTSWAHRTSW